MTSTVHKFGRWARDIAERAGRTAAQVFAAYLTVVMQVGGPVLDWGVALTQVAFATVLSLLTSMVSLPSFGDQWVFQVTERAVKTFAQYMVAGIGTATIFAEVDWNTIVQSSWLAALYSVIMSVATTRAGQEAARGSVNLTAPKSISVSAAERSGASGF
jgi:hypothetical protein